IMAAGQKWLPWLITLWPLLLSSGALPAHWLPGEYENSSSDALRFLSDYNSTAEEVFSFAASASWNYNTNLTDYNSRLQVEALLEFDDFSEAWGVKAKTVFTEELIDSLPDPKDKVLIKNIKILGSANLQQNEREEKRWPNPETTTNCCSSGRLGTTRQDLLRRNSTPGLWSSATKPSELMVRTYRSILT
uniref:Uncharacterized protein n=1 Tax=Oryzias melastigma TaxID=30732 RepID=A0A3B3BH02_ORYME